MLIYKCDNKMYFYLMNTNHTLHEQSVILITGAAGFIASGMASYLSTTGLSTVDTGR
jgi:NADP-dependent 3-hydroxy acid dehydrogenase YdfG